jgi:hypothetical protein
MEKEERKHLLHIVVALSGARENNNPRIQYERTAEALQHFTLTKMEVHQAPGY